MAKKTTDINNSRLKNWEYLPKGLKLFYEEEALKSIVFRVTRNGTKIQVKKKEPSRSWTGYDGKIHYTHDIVEWYFRFNAEKKRFGLESTEEKLWIFAENDDAVMD